MKIVLYLTQIYCTMAVICAIIYAFSYIMDCTRGNYEFSTKSYLKFSLLFPIWMIDSIYKFIRLFVKGY